MSYSRWSNSNWHTFYTHGPKDIGNNKVDRNNQVMGVNHNDGVSKIFTYKELYTNLYSTLYNLKKEIGCEDSELDELCVYISNFKDDVLLNYPITDEERKEEFMEGFREFQKYHSRDRTEELKKLLDFMEDQNDEND